MGRYLRVTFGISKKLSVFLFNIYHYGEIFEGNVFENFPNYSNIKLQISYNYFYQN